MFLIVSAVTAQTPEESQGAVQRIIDTLTTLRENTLALAPVENNEEITASLNEIARFIDERPLLLEVDEIGTLRVQLKEDLKEDYTKPFLETEKGKLTTQTTVIALIAIALIYGVIALRRKVSKQKLKKKTNDFFANVDEIMELMQQKNAEIEQKAERTKDKAKITGDAMLKSIVENISSIIKINEKILSLITFKALTKAEEAEKRKIKKDENFIESLKKDDFIKQNAAVLTRLSKFDELEHKEKRIFAKIHSLLADMKNSLTNFRNSIAEKEMPRIAEIEKGKDATQVLHELESINKWTNQQKILFAEQWALITAIKSKRDELVSAIDKLIREEKEIAIAKKPAKKEVSAVRRAAYYAAKPSLTSKELNELCSEIILPEITAADAKVIEQKLKGKLIRHVQPPKMQLMLSAISKEETKLFYLRKDNNQTFDGELTVANKDFLRNLKMQISILGMHYLNALIKQKASPEEIMDKVCKQVGILNEKTVKALLKAKEGALTFAEAKTFIEKRAKELPAVIEKQFRKNSWAGIRQYGELQNKAIQQKINLATEKNKELVNMANKLIIQEGFIKWAKDKGFDEKAIEKELSWLTPFSVHKKEKTAELEKAA